MSVSVRYPRARTTQPTGPLTLNPRYANWFDRFVYVTPGGGLWEAKSASWSGQVGAVLGPGGYGVAAQADIGLSGYTTTTPLSLFSLCSLATTRAYPAGVQSNGGTEVLRVLHENAAAEYSIFNGTYVGLTTTTVPTPILAHVDTWDGATATKRIGNQITTTAFAGPWSAVPGRMRICRDDYLNGWTGALYLAAIANYCWSPAQCDQLVNNPWLMFSQYTPRIYSFPSSGTFIIVNDTGSAADATPAIAVTLGLSDSGAGVDAAPGAAAAVPLADTANAADLVAAISAALTLTDTAAGADAISILTDILLSVTDSGTATEVIASLLASLAVSDAATGTDAIATISATLALTEAGTGADAVPGISALLTLLDTATGAEALNVLQQVLVSITDSLLGADTITVSAAVALSETATGVDMLQSVAALLALADSGLGIDVAARFDAQVRLLKMTFTVRMRRIAFRMAKRTMTFKLAA
ncbi:MAG: hypothetical protein HYX63_13365 [Gammaproteobacteria bacterium]|nr:hypothetical protein [Gammaproteobacteria bacterium]